METGAGRGRIAAFAPRPQPLVLFVALRQPLAFIHLVTLLTVFLDSERSFAVMAGPA